MHQHTVIVICGPTAAGKTGVAIQIAKSLNTEIISADSRQCFQELNIGVAKPTAADLAAVHHWFINSHSIIKEVNAGVFEKYALSAAEKIFENHTTAVMVGGTGLYIRAFCEGMDNIPLVDTNMRNKVLAEYEQNGLKFLQKEIAEKDPDFWKIAEQQNPARLMRALEVFLSTGKSITTFRKGDKKDRPFKIIKIGLTLPRPQLYQQIDNRVDAMIEQGLLNEVSELCKYESLNALQTVGYKELFDHLNGKLSLEHAIENIKTNTRHYAKRQLTWFKKDTKITWFNPNDIAADNMLAAINPFK